MVRRAKIMIVFSISMAVLALVFGGVTQVKAVNIITNGSFETGDFTGWGTKDMAVPFYSLGVRGAGTSPGFGLFQSAPTDGSFAATHGFDGGGPDTIEIFQDVAIPPDHSAILTLDWRAGWNFTFGTSATVRILDLVVEPAGGGSPLSTTNILTADPAVNMVLLDTSPKSDLVDLSAFAGSSIRINFLSTIPDNFSGPAHLQIDNVVLDVQPILLSDIATIHIDEAIAEKREALERIDAALEKEWVAYEALEELLESGDYGDLDKGDIVKAKQDIHSATQREERSIDTLVKSIENLEDALAALGVEPELDPNLVGHWKFDEGSGTTATDSAGDNDGTLIGDPNWVAGKVGSYALDFDGDGVYLEGSSGTSSPLNIYDSDITISSWVKIGTGGTIVARAKPHYITYSLYTTSTKACVNVYVSGGSGHTTVCSDEILNQDTWYHIVGVFDRSLDKGYVYVNGILEADGSMPDAPSGNDALTKIGCRSNTNDFPFNGTIDDVRIYDRVLSAEEIQQLYQDGLSGPGKGKK